MLDASWCQLLREKLSMARQVLRVAEQFWHQNPGPTNEGLVQGALGLIDEARTILLKQVAKTCQLDDFEGVSLFDLRQRAGDDPGELRILEGFERDADSWWSRLDALLAEQRTPRKRDRRPQADDLIAVADASAPDRSPAAVQSLIDEFGTYFEAFTERHDQW